MAEIFVSPIEAQPLFPFEDVTDNNAQFLGMMMANKLMVAEGHKVSESSS